MLGAKLLMVFYVSSLIVSCIADMSLPCFYVPLKSFHFIMMIKDFIEMK